MSNKISGFTVVFEESVSEEYMDRIKNVVLLLHNTATVEPIVEDTSTYIGQSKEAYRIKNFLIEAIKNDFKKSNT